MRTGWIIAACAAAAVWIVGISAHAESGRDFAEDLLAHHNAARAKKGAPDLRWSSKLAREAQAWAHVIAKEGRMRHASRVERGGAGENLWMGAAGYYGAREMIETFVDEERYYRRGKFPDVSSTGQWKDVAHYTQIVWPTTQEVGCAVARDATNDFLVCRYWPAGNRDGVSID